MKGDYLFPVPESQWEALLRESPDATIFQTPGWARVLNETYGYRPATRLFETSDGEVLVPMVEMRRFGMNALSSIPLGYGGPVTPGHPVGRLGELLGTLVGGRTLRLYLTLPPRMGPVHTPMAMAGFEEQTSDWNYCHILDLAGGPEAVLARAHRRIRRDIPHAQRRHVEVEEDNSIDGLRQLYGIYTQRSKEWGYATPPHPFRLYEAIQRHLGPHTHLLLAKRDGDTIGGLMHFTYGRTDTPWLLAVTSASRTDNPGTLLTYHAIVVACREGAEYLNLGSSGPLDGVRTYKERWGAVEVSVRQYICRSPLDRFVGRFGRPFTAMTEDHPDAGHGRSGAG